MKTLQTIFKNLKFKAFLNKVSQIALISFLPVFTYAANQINVQVIPISQLIRIYFTQFDKNPYVICDKVLNDDRLVSIRSDSKNLKKAVFYGVLDINGYTVINKGNVKVVCTKPKPKKTDEIIANKLYIYKPRFLSVSYLISVISPLFPKGKFANSRNVGLTTYVKSKDSQNTNNKNAGAPNKDNLLIYYGSYDDIKIIKKLLSALDVEPIIHKIKLYVYEYKITKNHASAWDFIVNYSKDFLFNFSFNPSQQINNSFIKLGNSDISLLASNLNQNQNFNLLTNPVINLKNHETYSFFVGDNIPVKDKIVIDNNGNRNTSFKYQSTGLKLLISSDYKENFINLGFDMVLSDYVVTSDNPIIQKRQIKTNLSLEKGEIYFLGGLKKNKNNNNNKSFFNLFNIASSNASSKSEIFIMLQVI